MKITGINNINIEVIKLFESNYCYIISSNKEAIVIDPGESEPVLNYLKKNNLKLISIYLTHNDFDHSGGIEDLKNVFDINIINYKSDKTQFFNKTDISILKTPGHSIDSCCFYIKSEGIVFTGDTLFIGVCGKVRNNMFTQMFESLKILKSLPGETKILPGHEYLDRALVNIERLEINSSFYKSIIKKANPSLHSTINYEIKNNPFMTEDFNIFYNLRK